MATIKKQKAPAKQKRKKDQLKKILRRRHRQREHSPAASPSDMEDLLINSVIVNDAKAINGTDMENLIYNTTNSTAEMGYNFGFSVGRALGLKLKDRRSFISVLNRMGLHDSLYHPFRDQVLVTSRPTHSHSRMQLNRSIHVYEAGIISGYLSTVATTPVNTVERRCVYAGSDSCQFVSTPLSPRPRFEHSGVEAVTDAIALTLNDGRYSKSGKEYYRVLAYLPLLETGLSKQILSMMVLSGQKLGSISGKKGFNHAVTNVANYLGARECTIDRRGIKRIIKLRYESYNSMKEFVSIGAAIIAGLSGSIGMNAEVSFVTNRDKSYTTIIETKPKRM